MYLARDVCHIIQCRCHIGDLIRCRSHITDLLRCGTHNSDVETVKCELGFCYDCPSEKVSQKFLQISVEKMRDLFLFFALKKSLAGTETVARCVSSRGLCKQSPVDILGVMVDNLETVAARMVMGVFMD